MPKLLLLEFCAVTQDFGKWSTTSIPKDPRPKEEDDAELITPKRPPQSSKYQNRSRCSQSTTGPTKIQPTPHVDRRGKSKPVHPIRPLDPMAHAPPKPEKNPRENLLCTAATIAIKDDATDIGDLPVHRISLRVPASHASPDHRRSHYHRQKGRRNGQSRPTKPKTGKD